MPKKININKELNKIKNELRYSPFHPNQWDYIYKTLSKEKKRIMLFFTLCGLEAILTVFIPLFIKIGIESNYNLLHIDTLLVSFAVMTLVVTAFIVNGYVTLRLGQKISYYFINQIKKDWVNKYLSIPSARAPNLENGNLLAKIVYHTQLLKVGMERVLFQGVSGVFLYLAILAGAFLFFSELFLFFLL